MVEGLFSSRFGLVLCGTVFGLAAFAFLFVSFFGGGPGLSFFAFGAASSTVTATTTVIVGNATPVVSAITINNGSDITLTPNATTAVSVASTISDNNGCADVTNATATIMIYRSGYTSSTCLSTTSDLSCYRLTVFSTTSSCQNSVTVYTTTTFGVYYFAQATDASSSFASQNWKATLNVRDTANATASLDSSGVELLTLTAINVTTSSVDYGTLSASSTTGSTNQVTTSTNAGNSSTTLRLSANSTLTSGSNSIATSSQKYATSTFTVGVGTTSTDLTDTPVTVNGFFLTSPTSTSNVADEVFWGLTVPAGTATGTYNGVNLFTSLFQG